MKTEQEQEQEIQQNLQFVNRLREIYKQRAGELMRPLSKKKEKDEEEPRYLNYWRPCTTVEELEKATVLKIENEHTIMCDQLRSLDERIDNLWSARKYDKANHRLQIILLIILLINFAIGIFFNLLH